jgi:uroporphyrinogen-III synthase
MAQGTLGRLRIALTREQAANAELAALLRAAGATIFECPLIRIQPPSDATPLNDALKRVEEYDWLVLTSANAARAVIERVEIPTGTRIACVGDAPAAIVRESGLTVSLIPKRTTSKGLLEALVEHGLKGVRVLWPRSELAPQTLKRGLQTHGAEVDDPVAYRNAPDPGGMERLQKWLAQGAVNAVAFASASAAANALKSESFSLRMARLYTIGPSTSQVLLDAGLQIAGEAADHSARGLFEVIAAGESERE